MAYRIPKLLPIAITLQKGEAEGSPVPSAIMLASQEVYVFGLNAYGELGLPYNTIVVGSPTLLPSPAQACSCIFF